MGNRPAPSSAGPFLVRKVAPWRGIPLAIGAFAMFDFFMKGWAAPPPARAMSLAAWSLSYAV